MCVCSLIHCPSIHAHEPNIHIKCSTVASDIQNYRVFYFCFIRHVLFLAYIKCVSAFLLFFSFTHIYFSLIRDFCVRFDEVSSVIWMCAQINLANRKNWMWDKICSVDSSCPLRLSFFGLKLFGFRDSWSWFKRRVFFFSSSLTLNQRRRKKNYNWNCMKDKRLSHQRMQKLWCKTSFPCIFCSQCN